MTLLRRRYLSVALAVAAGAILLCSCREAEPEVDLAAEEGMMTEYSEHLTIVQSENGRRSYRFTTPLVEGYSQAREPYREFRKGIRMETYRDDSLTSVDAVLTANYAIYYENRKLWEAKGNVVVEKYDGKKLYTQQLFWNATTKKIYSNVDTRVVQEGRNDIIGAGFESDEEFKDWRFRYMKGTTEVDMTPRETTDSTRVAAPADSTAAAAAATPAAPATRPTAKPAEKPAASRPVRGERPERPEALPGRPERTLPGGNARPADERRRRDPGAPERLDSLPQRTRRPERNANRE